jgi:hypothetical protein
LTGLLDAHYFAGAYWGAGALTLVLQEG